MKEGMGVKNRINKTVKSTYECAKNVECTRLFLCSHGKPFQSGGYYMSCNYCTGISHSLACIKDEREKRKLGARESKGEYAETGGKRNRERERGRER